MEYQLVKHAGKLGFQQNSLSTIYDIQEWLRDEHQIHFFVYNEPGPSLDPEYTVEVLTDFVIIGHPGPEFRKFGQSFQERMEEAVDFILENFDSIKEDCQLFLKTGENKHIS